MTWYITDKLIVNSIFISYNGTKWNGYIIKIFIEYSIEVLK